MKNDARFLVWLLAAIVFILALALALTTCSGCSLDTSRIRANGDVREVLVDGDATDAPQAADAATDAPQDAGAPEVLEQLDGAGDDATDAPQDAGDVHDAQPPEGWDGCVLVSDQCAACNTPPIGSCLLVNHVDWWCCR